MAARNHHGSLSSEEVLGGLLLPADACERWRRHTHSCRIANTSSFKLNARMTSTPMASTVVTGRLTSSPIRSRLEFLPATHGNRFYARYR